VSEIFSGKRKLTINMIRSLRKHLHISADVLIAEEPEVTSNCTPHPVDAI